MVLLADPPQRVRPLPNLKQGFHVMLKPRGPVCNLNCRYCYYLRKKDLYPGSRFRMDDDTLETYVRDYIAAQPEDAREVTFAWQGGEPTLMGMAFFQKAVALQRKYARPGMVVSNAFQTNGTTLDDTWCRFLHDHDFLVGISIDGPPRLHDAYRRDRGERPTFERVRRGLDLLRQHRVEHNILTTVHAANQDYPLEVYRFLRDNLGAAFIQFIPIVERTCAFHAEPGQSVAPHSVNPEAFGRFLLVTFEEWLRRDLGRVSLQIADVALMQAMGLPAGLCVFEKTCGHALALEHNGDVYSCDHFVEPAARLGNLTDTPLADLVHSRQQQGFGWHKRDSLPGFCRRCPVLDACNGACPKDRFMTTPDGEPGLNYLCAAYRAFFQRVREPLQGIGQSLRAGYSLRTIRPAVARSLQGLDAAVRGANRNEGCPCGSGLKVKRCHGSAPLRRVTG